MEEGGREQNLPRMIKCCGIYCFGKLDVFSLAKKVTTDSISKITEKQISKSRQPLSLCQMKHHAKEKGYFSFNTFILALLYY